MRSEGKSDATVKTYGGGVAAFIRWCEATGADPVIDKPTVQTFIGSLLDAGAEPATAHARLKALRRFTAWLLEEDEIDSDPLLGAVPPRVPHKVTPALTDEQLRRLIRACQGKTLKDRRDEAVVRLMAETGLRAGEVVALTVPDINLDEGLVTVRRGKGGKGRVAPFGPQTTAALDRYLRAARRERRLTENGALWVGLTGKPFGYSGLDATLKDRAETAGIKGFHLHLLRHTAATRWLRAGGSEGGPMAVAGWASRSAMDDRINADPELRRTARALGIDQPRDGGYVTNDELNRSIESDEQFHRAVWEITRGQGVSGLKPPEERFYICEDYDAPWNPKPQLVINPDGTGQYEMPEVDDRWLTVQGSEGINGSFPNNNMANALVEAAVADGRIAVQDHRRWVGAIVADPEGAKRALASLPPQRRP